MRLSSDWNARVDRKIARAVIHVQTLQYNIRYLWVRMNESDSSKKVVFVPL